MALAISCVTIFVCFVKATRARNCMLSSKWFLFGWYRYVSEHNELIFASNIEHFTTQITTNENRHKTSIAGYVARVRNWRLYSTTGFHDSHETYMVYSNNIKSFFLPVITICDSQITSSQARNLGVIFDSTMTLKPHISNIVRVSSFHIRDISRIRKYLNQSAAEQIIHAFVTSRLDNGNALLYGLPQNQISRLQHIQNTAARVVPLPRKSCHHSNLERTALASCFTDNCF